MNNYNIPKDKSMLFFDFYLMEYTYSLCNNDSYINRSFYNYEDNIMNFKDISSHIIDKIYNYIRLSLQNYNNYIDSMEKSKGLLYENVNKVILSFNNSNITTLCKIMAIDKIFHYCHNHGSIFNFNDSLSVKSSDPNSFTNTTLCKFHQNNTRTYKYVCPWIDVFIIYRSMINSLWELYEYCSIKSLVSKILKFFGNGTYNEFRIKQPNNTYLYELPEWVKIVKNLHKNYKDKKLIDIYLNTGRDHILKKCYYRNIIFKK